MPYAQDQSRQCLPGIEAVTSGWKWLYNGVTGLWVSFSNYPGPVVILTQKLAGEPRRSENENDYHDLGFLMTGKFADPDGSKRQRA